MILPPAQVLAIGNTQDVASNITWSVPVTTYSTIDHYTVAYYEYDTVGLLVLTTATSPVSVYPPPIGYVIPNFDPTHSYSVEVDTIGVDGQIGGSSVESISIPPTPSSIVLTFDAVNNVLQVTWTETFSTATVGSYMVCVTYNNINPPTWFFTSNLYYNITSVTCGTDIKVILQAAIVQSAGPYSAASASFDYPGYSCPDFTVTPLVRYRGDNAALAFTTPVGGNSSGFTGTITDPISGYSFTATGLSSPFYLINLNQSVTYTYTITAHLLTTNIQSTIKTATFTMYNFDPSFWITFNTTRALATPGATISDIVDISNNNRSSAVVGVGTPGSGLISITVSTFARIRSFTKTASTDNYFYVTAPTSATFTWSFWIDPTSHSTTTEQLLSTLNHGLIVQYNSGVLQVLMNSATLTSTSTLDLVGVNSNSLTWTHYAVVFNGTYLLLYRNGDLTDIVATTDWVGTAGNDIVTVGESMIGSIDDIMAFNYVLSSIHIYNIFTGQQSTVTSISPVLPAKNTPSSVFDVTNSYTGATGLPISTFTILLPTHNPALGTISQELISFTFTGNISYIITCTSASCTGSTQFTLKSNLYSPNNFLIGTVTNIVPLATQAYGMSNGGTQVYNNVTRTPSLTSLLTTNLPLVLFSWLTIARTTSDVLSPIVAIRNNVTVDPTFISTTGTILVSSPYFAVQYPITDTIRHIYFPDLQPANITFLNVTPIIRFKGDHVLLSCIGPPTITPHFDAVINDPLSGYSLSLTRVRSPIYFINLNQSTTYNYTVTSYNFNGGIATVISSSFTTFHWDPSFYITFNDSTINDISSNTRTTVAVGGTVVFSSNANARIKEMLKSTTGDPYFYIIAPVGTTYTLSFWVDGNPSAIGTYIIMSTTGLTIQFIIATAPTCLLQVVQGSDTITSVTTVGVGVHYAVVYNGTHVIIYRNALVDGIGPSTGWTGTSSSDHIQIAQSYLGGVDDLVGLNYATTIEHINAIRSSTAQTGLITPSLITSFSPIPTSNYDVSTGLLSPISMKFYHFNPAIGIASIVTVGVTYSCSGAWTVTCNAALCSGTTRYAVTINEYTPSGGLIAAKTFNVPSAAVSYSNLLLAGTAPASGTNTASDATALSTSFTQLINTGTFANTTADLYSNLYYNLSHTVPVAPALTQTQSVGSASVVITSFTCKITAMTWQTSYYVDQQIITSI